jgi:homoserine O-succinyltransferase
MADKPTTEAQLAKWFGASPVQVNLTFATTDSYIDRINDGHESKTTPIDHIHKFYPPFRAVKQEKYDGVVITGVNALKQRVQDEDYWPEIAQILDWTETNATSSLFLCWGAKAALKRFHNIDSIKGKRKLFGLFTHKLGEDLTGLLFGFPDNFKLPVSRWKSPRPADVFANAALEVVAHSPEAGPNVIVESAPYANGTGRYAKRVFVLGHPEYDTDTLGNEYRRDHSKASFWDRLFKRDLPKHYFPRNNPKNSPVNDWRQTAALYTNWVHQIYRATPFNPSLIPKPSSPGGYGFGEGK